MSHPPHNKTRTYCEWCGGQVSGLWCHTAGSHYHWSGPRSKEKGETLSWYRLPLLPLTQETIFLQPWQTQMTAMRRNKTVRPVEMIQGRELSEVTSL